MIQEPNAKTPSLMRAFYDLSKASLSFDVLHFMAMADTNRRILEFDGLHFILVVPPEYGDENCHWRVGNIILPALPMLAGCKKITICTDREQAREILDADTSQTYPENYQVDDPPSSGCEMYRLFAPAFMGAEASSISAPGRALKYVDDWASANADGRKVISITVRAREHRPEKNNNMDAWITLARELDRDGYLPVILGEHEENYGCPGYEGFASFPQAVSNLQVRTAFYERSYLNLFSPNGPSALCWVNGNTRYILFNKINCRSEGEMARPHVLGEHGFRYGDQLPFARPYQKWVWEPDSLDCLRKETNLMLNLIAANEEDALQFGPLIPRLSFEKLLEIVQTLREFGNDACANIFAERLAQLVDHKI